MEDRPILRLVDLFSPEHLLDGTLEIRLFGKAEKELEGLLGDPVLRVIQENVIEPDREFLETSRARGEEILHVEVLCLVEVLCESLPARRPGGIKFSSAWPRSSVRGWRPCRHCRLVRHRGGTPNRFCSFEGSESP